MLAPVTPSRVSGERQPSVVRDSPERSAQARAFRVGSLLLALLIGSAGLLLGQPAAGDWSIDTAQSRLTIHVLPAGLLSSALHPHHFQPERWSGEVSWDPDRPDNTRVEVRVSADSLRDRQPALSAKDIEKVERQTRGPEILDAQRFPTIVFRAQKLELEPGPSGAGGKTRGTLTGTLELHGKTLPVQFPIEGEASGGKLQVGATARFRQSDFGIKPYSTALGTIAVRDEITVEISLVGLPADRKTSSATSPAKAKPGNSAARSVVLKLSTRETARNRLNPMKGWPSLR